MREKAKQADVVIIGAAAAGLSAALFCARRGLRTLVITKDIGGQLATTVDVENYPGLNYITGYDLANTMAQQAQKYGAELFFAEVNGLAQAGESAFTITTHQGQVTARAVIIALGKTPRSLNVPGERELFGKGVGHAASVVIPQYAGKTVAIVGGGSAAFEAARLAIKTAAQVLIIHRNHDFRAEAAVVNEIKAATNVIWLLDRAITKINGTDRVTGISVAPVESGTPATPNGAPAVAPADYPCDAVLIEIGFEIKRDMFNGLLDLSTNNSIIINEQNATSVPGIFAAGDITNRPHNQAIISAGEGANAALSAYSYLTGKPAGADWGMAK